MNKVAVDFKPFSTNDRREFSAVTENKSPAMRANFELPCIFYSIVVDDETIQVFANEVDSTHTSLTHTTITPAQLAWITSGDVDAIEIVFETCDWESQ